MAGERGRGVVRKWEQFDLFRSSVLRRILVMPGMGRPETAARTGLFRICRGSLPLERLFESARGSLFVRFRLGMLAIARRRVGPGSGTGSHERAAERWRPGCIVTIMTEMVNHIDMVCQAFLVFSLFSAWGLMSSPLRMISLRSIRQRRAPGRASVRPEMHR